MDDVIKVEAKDFVMSGIEKASGQFGINIEVCYIYTTLLFILSPKHSVQRVIKTPYITETID